MINDYFAEEDESHNGDQRENIDVLISNTLLTSVQQTEGDDSLSGEAYNTEAGDNELDRNLMEESHQMELENNNLANFPEVSIVDYDETSEGENRYVFTL